MPLEFKPILNDIAETNIKLEALYNAYNALEAKINNLSSGSTRISSTTTTTGSTGESKIVVIGENEFWKEIRTDNYGKTFNDGGTVGAYRYGAYSTHPNNSDGKFNRPDQPFIIASYNSKGNNARDFQNEYNWDMTVEPFWWNPTLGEPSIEPHIFRMKDKKNIEHRYLSLYAGVDTGNAFWNMEGSSFNIYHNPNATPGVQGYPAYFSTYDGQIFLNNTTPNNSGTGITLKNQDGQTITIHQRGGVPVLDIPKSNAGDGKSYFHYDGYGHLKMIPNSIYNGNQEALNGGLNKGDAYWTQIKDSEGKIIKVLAQVE